MDWYGFRRVVAIVRDLFLIVFFIVGIISLIVSIQTLSSIGEAAIAVQQSPLITSLASGGMVFGMNQIANTNSNNTNLNNTNSNGS